MRVAAKAGLHPGRVAALSAPKCFISELVLWGVKHATLALISIQITNGGHIGGVDTGVTWPLNHFLFEQPEDRIHSDLYRCFNTSQCRARTHNSKFRPIQREPHPLEINHIYCVNMITHNVTTAFPYHDEASQSPASGVGKSGAERCRALIGWTGFLSPL